jgi:hypothetical protein
VQLHLPLDHSPPRQGGEFAEDVLADRMFEVVGPAAHDQAEPDQHVPEVLLRRPACKGADLVLQLPDGPVSDEGVDVPLVRSVFAAPLDVEPEEVEPLTHVHDLRLRC